MPETWVQSWVGKIPWRRERLPTPVFWPGEFHGLRIRHDWATFTFTFHFHKPCEIGERFWLVKRIGELFLVLETQFVKQEIGLDYRITTWKIPRVPCTQHQISDWTVTVPGCTEETPRATTLPRYRVTPREPKERSTWTVSGEAGNSW